MEKKYQENLLNRIIKETSDSVESYSTVRISQILDEMVCMKNNQLLKRENSKISELINKLKECLYTKEIILYNNNLNFIEAELLKLETVFSPTKYSSLKQAVKTIKMEKLPSKFMLSRVDSITQKLASIAEELPNSQEKYNLFTPIIAKFREAGTNVTIANVHDWAEKMEKIKEKLLDLGINTSILEVFRSLNTTFIALRKDLFGKQGVDAPQISGQGQKKMEEIYEGSRAASPSITSLDEGIELNSTFEYNPQEDSDPERNDNNYEHDNLQFRYNASYRAPSSLCDGMIETNQATQLLGTTTYTNAIPTTEL